jgi:hypothetical protein
MRECRGEYKREKNEKGKRRSWLKKNERKRKGLRSEGVLVLKVG